MVSKDGTIVQVSSRVDRDAVSDRFFGLPSSGLVPANGKRTADANLGPKTTVTYDEEEKAGAPEVFANKKRMNGWRWPARQPPPPKAAANKKAEKKLAKDKEPEVKSVEA